MTNLHFSHKDGRKSLYVVTREHGVRSYFTTYDDLGRNQQPEVLDAAGAAPGCAALNAEQQLVVAQVQ